ncbi:hypothetical protein [Vallitalea guaymasensis]|uniref:Uncharacterized protein n=1 Tax=Vallitalea guaymasensis TaxID=1185412 RepID=A0A8J8M9F7_9FIRM|nr:hypothetical protein [Vallitalea guaymasensis]QUH28782.1 hypothetical protein HYG85_07600 [Vallitalea guaymasensis]
MLQKILSYLNKKSKDYNYCCDILGNYIYNIQSDVITRLKKVNDKYVLMTSERGKDTIKFMSNDQDEALLMTLLLLEKTRYSNKRSELSCNDINDVMVIMEHAKNSFEFASPELNVCKDNNFSVVNIDNNYLVIFKADNKKYIVFNTQSDELWAYQVAFNYSLELDNYYYINKELVENHIITDELGKEYLYRFLELNKYEILS